MREPASKMTKAERLNWKYAIDAMEMVERDLHHVLWKYQSCPSEWHQIWKDKDRRDTARARVTLSLDADVVKFFKAMGPGYQARLNRVLRAFMHFRLAKLVEGPDTTDYILRPDIVEKRAARRRPDWGDTERALDPGPET